MTNDSISIGKQPILLPKFKPILITLGALSMIFLAGVSQMKGVPRGEIFGLTIIGYALFFVGNAAWTHGLTVQPKPGESPPGVFERCAGGFSLSCVGAMLILRSVWYVLF